MPPTSPFRPAGTSAFVNQLLVYTLVMICFSGSVGLGTVWLRHQISLTANRSKQIEARIAEVERNWAEKKAAVETEQGPDMLKQRNAELHLGLVPPTEPQVSRVSQDPGLLLAAKHNRDLFADPEIKLTRFRLPADR
ncbi:MAG TPA: hypothetical protein VG838_09645 [Opitutaceae bacterium]|nr:hypothetical protein [Opitutaceae bacterium]